MYSRESVQRLQIAIRSYFETVSYKTRSRFEYFGSMCFSIFIFHLLTLCQLCSVVLSVWLRFSTKFCTDTNLIQRFLKSRVQPPPRTLNNMTTWQHKQPNTLLSKPIIFTDSRINVFNVPFEIFFLVRWARRDATSLQKIAPFRSCKKFSSLWLT